MVVRRAVILLVPLALPALAVGQPVGAHHADRPTSPAAVAAAPSAVARAYAELAPFGVPGDADVIAVDIANQTLTLADGGVSVGTWPIASGRGGVSSRVGSGGTPAGVHRVGMVLVGRRGETFKHRRRTGNIAKITGDSHGRAHMTTALLTLEGQELGNASSSRRGIYIHGTNLEGSVGRPLSSGCVRMRNDDVLTLAQQVPAGTWVVVLP